MRPLYGFLRRIARLDSPAGPSLPGRAPLATLPALAIDTETTGLNPARDRIVSLALVSIDRLAAEAEPVLTSLVDPGMAIPPASTAIHGIKDADVRGAPAISDLLPRVAEAMSGRLVIGHYLLFDLDLLARAARRAGVRWRPPVALCTARLTAALEPSLARADVFDIARRFGDEPQDRHTALGDARAAAAIYAHLARRMIERGQPTLADALHLAERGRI